MVRIRVAPTDYREPITILQFFAIFFQLPLSRPGPAAGDQVPCISDHSSRCGMQQNAFESYNEINLLKEGCQRNPVKSAVFCQTWGRDELIT